MHDQIVDLVGTILSLPRPLAAGDSGSVTIETGIIAGIALVLASLLPAIFGRKEREPKAVRDLRAAERKLREELETDRDEWKKKAEDGALEINRLRNLCMTATPPINPFQAEDHHE